MFALVAKIAAEVFLNFQNTGIRLIKINVSQNVGADKCSSI
jgi:hypothetical protein